MVTEIEDGVVQMPKVYFERRLVDGQFVGKRAAWGEVVKLTRILSGEAYAQGDDNAAHVMRRLAERFEVHEKMARKAELDYRRDFVETAADPAIDAQAEPS